MKSFKNEEMALRVKRLTEHAVLPSRATAGSAGYDVSASQAAVVPRHGRAVVPTDLSIAIPPGHYARLAPRSGLAVKVSGENLFLFSFVFFFFFSSSRHF
jgi:deoxyuridine 5'-triphosphate nucleotidohydrolase